MLILEVKVFNNIHWNTKVVPLAVSHRKAMPTRPISRFFAIQSKQGWFYKVS